jgi:hypothetical protein
MINVSFISPHQLKCVHNIRNPSGVPGAPAPPSLYPSAVAPSSNTFPGYPSAGGAAGGFPPPPSQSAPPPPFNYNIPPRPASPNDNVETKEDLNIRNIIILLITASFLLALFKKISQPLERGGGSREVARHAAGL